MNRALGGNYREISLAAGAGGGGGSGRSHSPRFLGWSALQRKKTRLTGVWVARRG
ncbi:MAG: hypothetical protein GY820_37320 [Gammaproteobacteria bacterium]|nr:hypothetical protein [Gammaproteobacteria bacterium]